MTFIELIGFVVTLIAFLVLSVKKTIEDRKRRIDPDGYDSDEQQKSEKLRSFLKAIDLDMKEPKKQRTSGSMSNKSQKIPKPQKKERPQLMTTPAKEPYTYSNSIEDRQLHVGTEKQMLKSTLDSNYKLPTNRLSSLNAYQINDKDAYSLVKLDVSTRASRILSSLSSKKEMLILHELISPPKALRK